MSHATDTSLRPSYENSTDMLLTLSSRSEEGKAALQEIGRRMEDILTSFEEYNRRVDKVKRRVLTTARLPHLGHDGLEHHTSKSNERRRRLECLHTQATHIESRIEELISKTEAFTTTFVDWRDNPRVPKKYFESFLEDRKAPFKDFYKSKDGLQSAVDAYNKEFDNTFKKFDPGYEYRSPRDRSGVATPQLPSEEMTRGDLAQQVQSRLSIQSDS